MKKYTAYFLIVIILIGFTFVFYKKTKDSTVSPQNKKTDNTVQNIELNPNAPKLEKGVYTNSEFGFTLNLPESLKVSEFDEGEGHNVLIQGEISGVKNFSMQIYISYFDENISLTASRIHTDIPDLKMQEPIEIKTDGVSTVAFFSNDRGEKYREIWFVYNSTLYQIITKAEHDNITGKIMESWKWELK